MLSASASARRRRHALAAAFAATLFAVLAGCGGGGDDGPSQDALRSKLETAADKLAKVPSLDAAILISADLEEAAESSFCLDLVVERRQPTDDDDRVDLRTYQGDCGSGTVIAQVIVIGHDLWSSQGEHDWRPARIDPKLLGDLTEEDDKYEKLLAAADDIRQASNGPHTYEFTAPASAFAQTEGAGDVDVDFQATLDDQDRLTELSGRFEVEGSQAEFEQRYTKFGEAGPVEPPPPRDVHGPATRIESESELEAQFSG